MAYALLMQCSSHRSVTSCREALSKLKASVGDDVISAVIPGTRVGSQVGESDAADVVPAETDASSPPSLPAGQCIAHCLPGHCTKVQLLFCCPLYCMMYCRLSQIPQCEPYLAGFSQTLGLCCLQHYGLASCARSQCAGVGHKALSNSEPQQTLLSQDLGAR